MRKSLSVLMIIVGAGIASPALAQQARASAPSAAPAAPTQTPPAQTPPPTQSTPQAPVAGGARGGRGGMSPVAGTDYRMAGLPNPAVNVKLELSITDTYAGTPAKKTVTLLVSNGGSGMIRTSNRLPDGSPVNLNVDCQVAVLSVLMPGRDRGPEMMRTSLTFLYTPAQASQGEGRPAPRPADLTESVNVLLQDGKLTVVSQSADPATDRKVTVEVTATIIR